MSKKIIYRQIEEAIRKRIINGIYPVKSHLPADNLLAGEFSVSRLTVAKALNRLVEEGWLDRARGRGTFVADQLPLSPAHISGIIKFISPASISLGGIFTPDLLNGLLEGVREHGDNNVGIEIFKTEDELRELLETFSKPGMGGMVIWVSNNIDVNNILQKMRKEHFPFVQIDAMSMNSESDLVSCDNYYGAEMAVNHLAANGHKRIAYISIPLFQDNLKRRLGGVLAAMQTNDLNFDSSNIIVLPDAHKNTCVNIITEAQINYISDWVEKNYIQGSRENAPTAIFCSNDTIAIELLRILRTKGVKIPEEVEIIGFDNIPQADMPMIELTTVAQDFFTMGKMAAHMLFLPRDPAVPELEFRHYQMRPTLKIRKTAR